ncbi:MAG: 3-methyl-2-oxobutanoate hydroxymethyltransferase [Candidatus Omnitrophica bacterium]|nr:3-methyl-2-oxobutanoate hydroxymethyltransferase [Candidatus Omnitrophota bacterium]
MSNRLTVQQIGDKKKEGQKITMLTAYDYPMAAVIDKTGIDIILVGDSVANVVLGLESTRDVGMMEMLHHAKAVSRAVSHAVVVGDMPYESYQIGGDAPVDNAKRFIDEAGCDAVKLEWFEDCLAVTEKIVAAGIPVMGHVGLTPQTAEEFKVQGKNSVSAQAIVDQAKALEAKGCFSVVMECIPDRLAEMITKKLSIPTIGIGAGPYCDGQVLVTHDLVGLYDAFRPKFAKRYLEVGTMMAQGIEQFHQDVINGKFPSKEHSFSINDEELNKLNP